MKVLGQRHATERDRCLHRRSTAYPIEGGDGDLLGWSRICDDCERHIAFQEDPLEGNPFCPHREVEEYRTTDEAPDGVVRYCEGCFAFLGYEFDNPEEVV